MPGEFSLVCVLAALLLASIATGAPLPETGNTLPFRSDRILIKPRPTVAPGDLARFHAGERVRVVREFPQIEGVQVLALPAGADVGALVRRYQRSGLVEYAEPDYWLHLAVAPNDPSYADGSLWHLNNFGQSGGTADADIDAPEGWDTLHSASNVVVAVVDTGIRYTHEDLAANLWVNPGEIAGNGLDDDGDGYVDDVYGINAAANNGNPIDLFGHGTEVAGFIGAVGNNGLGCAGVAWRVKLMACRFYDDNGNGSVSDAVQAIDFARLKGAKVINASFVATNYSSTLYSAINSCRIAGIILVAAAGNDAQDNDVNPHYPASFNLDNVVAVAATTRNDALASFSDFGATSVQLGAPGEVVLSTSSSSDSAYAWGSGTSFSSPIVAGAFALMRARYPGASYLELINRVLAATDPLPALAGKCVSGGRLNIARALGPSVIADFSASPLAGSVPLTVQFTNLSFGVLTGVQWNFGDGASSSAPNPVHTFNAQGDFVVNLTVTGSSGATSTTNRTIVAVANYQMTNAAFAWIDPSGMASLNLSGDAVSPAQSLPFAFQFYGQTVSSLYVGANGLIGFENQGLSSPANTDLPNANAPNSLICPFWDDLNPSAASVRIGTTGAAPNRKLVISWVAVSGGGGGPPAAFTFQVVLEETSNTILFQYLEVQPGSRNSSAEGRSATVGLEHRSGLVGRKYSYNGSTLLANNLAILFRPASGTAANLPPSVAVTAPADNTVFGAPATVALQATASDADGSVSQVEFFDGGTALGLDTTSPYSVSVNGLTAGPHTLSAVATDNLGAKATNSVGIVVDDPPTVSISSPADGASFAAGANITVAANAGDTDGSVTNVEFFEGATRLGQDTANPYRFTWNNVAAGNYLLTARATDDRGVSMTSAAVSIKVTNAAPTAVTLLSADMTGSGFNFSFATEAGHNYTVQWTAVLPATNWLNLTNLMGNGAIAVITDSVPTDAQRFYRVGAD